MVSLPLRSHDLSRLQEYINDSVTPEVKYSFTGGQVTSLDERGVSIIANGNCAGVPLAAFKKNFVKDEDRGREFKYFVTIRNLKEEVKDERMWNPESQITMNNFGIKVSSFLF